MWITSRNSPTDTTKYLGTHDPVKLIHEINHYKRLKFHLILLPLSYRNWPWVHGFISGLSILFHWSMCLALEFHLLLFLLPSFDGKRWGTHEEERGKVMSVRGQVSQATDGHPPLTHQEFPPFIYLDKKKNTWITGLKWLNFTYYFRVWLFFFCSKFCIHRIPFLCYTRSWSRDPHFTKHSACFCLASFGEHSEK